MQDKEEVADQPVAGPSDGGAGAAGVENPQVSLPEGTINIPAADSTEAGRQPTDAGRDRFHRRFFHWYVGHKRWSIPASLLLVIVLVFVVPGSRYATAGLVLKKNATIVVEDSVTNTPVSGATVSYGSVSVTTDAVGKATLHSLSVGHHSLTITKKYYQDGKLNLLVPIFKAKTMPELSLVATGRQVKIKVVNYIDGSALADVDVSIAGTNAKTDQSGQAIVVVPSGIASLKATLGLNGYDNSDVSVKVSDQTVAENDFKLVPAGRVYFFSNRSGTMDLMKANLDGSDPQVVVAGTGTETPSNSFISQSPDWNYVALVVKRSASDATPQLYIVSTTDDKLLSVDSGNATFTVQGWAGDSLIYTVSRTDLPNSQAGKNKLKSYDATTGKITLLDQSTVFSENGINEYETYGSVFVMGNTVIYSKNWSTDDPYAISDRQPTIYAIGADGQNHKTVASYSATDHIYTSQHSPNSIYIQDQPSSGSATTYYDYTAGAAAPKQASIDSSQFYAQSQGYYPSPSGSQVLWTQVRDGKNAILVGGSDGSTPSTVASFNDYLPYGWYTDKYLLLTLKSNELYIMSAKGGTPLKITDYQSTNYFY